jgi:methionine sulfoxide reductase heme-binding subunit
MSATYQPILWNPQKKRYDIIMLILMVVYLVIFIGTTLARHGDVITSETVVIRATGSLAIVMLHIILMIGPLSRLNKKFLPLLYNRRHLGVTMFLVAAIHGVFSIIQFHGLGNSHPLVSLFTANVQYGSLPLFPFQTLGFFALVILFLMAATSHDFWLKNLSPKVWKTLHMMVYVAYAFLVMHVMLGVIQLEKAPNAVIALFVGMVALISLHLIAAYRQANAGKLPEILTKDDFIKVCHVDEIVENRAKLVIVREQSIAIFKYKGRLSAVSNFCQHQNGPLSEGKFVDGCITCPWHGYQYLPEDGCSPPPFTEKLATYHLKLIENEIWLNPNPEPEGTRIEAVVI